MEKDFILSRDHLQISCKLTEPEFGQIRRVVLGVHGLAGSANDLIQTGIAEEMAMFYAATFRFDFPGHGDSPMSDSDLTVENCVASLLTVAKHAQAQYPEVEDLCIFASGFGAYITLLASEELSELPGRVKLVVHTPSVLMHDTLLAMINMSRETFRAMDKITFPLERPLTLTYRFYQDLLSNIALTTHPIPMLILHGETDDYIPIEHIHNLHRINEDSKLVIIPGTSHRFLEEGAWDMVLDLTRDWFAFEQVLLADWV